MKIFDEPSTNAKTAVRVIVTHGDYGCMSGCCGHIVTLEDGVPIGEFDFLHIGETREGALQLAEAAVRRQFGPDHVADLEWDDAIVDLCLL